VGTFGPKELIECYRRGIFPMADNRDASNIFLLDPEDRAIFDLETFKPSRSMEKFRRKTTLRTSINEDFPQVIWSCAELRHDTWISVPIEQLYTVLHLQGEAHSVEVWDDDRLVGGLYGVSQGSAFFGESMFSTVTNASKLALIILIERLRERGFVLLDCQFMTDHLASLGAIEIPRKDYKARLAQALTIDAKFG
jgi:leucyl/phenylalanyl-tRNA--protein transferase